MDVIPIELVSVLECFGRWILVSHIMEKDMNRNLCQMLATGPSSEFRESVKLGTWDVRNMRSPLLSRRTCNDKGSNIQDACGEWSWYNGRNKNSLD